MHKRVLFLLVVFAATPFAYAGTKQESSDAVAQALAQGDAFFAKRNFEKAREAYLKADKLSHHACAVCLLRIFKVDRQSGDLSTALDDAKRALKAAGDDKILAAQAHLARGTLLAQMAGKPNDKKLKEAEEELREALALVPGQAVARLDLGMVLLRQGRDSEGIAELSNCISAPGANPSTVSEARRIIANPVRAREPFAPDFSFTTQEGVTVSNATLQGKVVLLDFWATWCGPCREAVPILLQIHKKYLNRPFEIVGISGDDNTQAWTNFIASHHMDWSEYIDLSRQVQQVFDINAFPTFVVLDGNGIIRFRQSGLSDQTQGGMEDAINKALKRPLQPSPDPVASAAPPSAQSGVPPAQIPAPPVTEKTIEDSSAQTTSVETSTISGDVYRNRFLGFSYEFPSGWIAAKPEGLRAANESIAASAKAFALQQHPESGGTPHIMVPKIIFYASRRGEGDGQRFAIPSLRITAMEWSLPELTLDTVKRDAERMEGAGMNLMRSPEVYSIGEQQLFRADFENTRTNPHSWMCHIQTVVEGYLHTLEIFAADKQELEQLARTTQSLSFDTP